MFIMWFQLCNDIQEIKKNNVDIIINDKKIDYTKYFDNIFYFFD